VESPGLKMISKPGEIGIEISEAMARGRWQMKAEFGALRRGELLSEHHRVWRHSEMMGVMGGKDICQ